MGMVGCICTMAGTRECRLSLQATTPISHSSPTPPPLLVIKVQVRRGLRQFISVMAIMEKRATCALQCPSTRQTTLSSPLDTPP
jgi:hypothetical protein